MNTSRRRKHKPARKELTTDSVTLLPAVSKPSFSDHSVHDELTDEVQPPIETRNAAVGLLRWALPLFVLIAGTLYALLIPPFQIPDEFAHLIRAYSIALGSWVADIRTPVPDSADKLLQRFPVALEQAGITKKTVRWTDLQKWIAQDLHPERTNLHTDYAANVYSGIPYMTTAAVLKVATWRRWSVLSTMWIARLCNLLVFSGLLYCAFRLLPDFHVFLTASVLMPMTLHQVSSFSADSFTIGIYIVLLAMLAKLSLDSRVETVNAQQCWLIIALLVIANLCKPYPLIAGLALLIPRRKFPRFQAYTLFVIAALVAVLGSTALWQTMNAENVKALTIAVRTSSVDAIGTWPTLRTRHSHLQAF